MASAHPHSLILNSAQGKYPVGNDPWVKGTAAAIASLAGTGTRLISSIGLNTWELATYLAGQNGIPLLLILPADDDAGGRKFFETVLDNFELIPERTEPVYIGAGVPGRPKSSWGRRDATAMELANAIYPVSIRSGGKLEALLRSVDDETTVIEDACRTEWSRSSYRPRYRLEGRTINPELGDRLDRFLTHWTRSCAGPWPGEKPSDFYRDLMDKPEGYVRDAGRAIVRMLGEGRIRGSSRHMPEGEPAVAFTALTPERTVPLMRWRGRYVRYSFEPYGIAISREVLQRMGAGPVIYRTGAVSRAVSPADRLFIQSTGETGEWVAEEEWRCRGDLSLKGIDPGAIYVIAEDRDAAERLRDEIDRSVEVLPLFV